MHLTIDRIESGLAVLIGRDDGSVRLDLPLSLLPDGSREGDVLVLRLERDEAATAETRKRVSLLLDKLKKKP